MIILIGNKCDMLKSFYIKNNIEINSKIEEEDNKEVKKENTNNINNSNNTLTNSINININSGGINNSDLDDKLYDEEVISKEEIIKIAEKNNMHYLETSAKLNNNIEEMFKIICEGLFDEAIQKTKRNSKGENDNSSTYKSLNTLNNENDKFNILKKKKKFKKCCS